MPSKRKKTDRENMPPPGPPKSAKRAKKPTSRSNSAMREIGNSSNEIDQVDEICGPLSKIFEKSQENIALHSRYCQELNNIYEKMQHEEFSAHFLRGLRVTLKFGDINRFADSIALFMIKFLASLRSNGDEAMHPMLNDVFQFVLKHTSEVNHVRLHLCTFLNLLLKGLGPDAEVDDDTYEKVLDYLFNALQDNLANIRLQAIHALCRLQTPHDKDDKVTKQLLFHLKADPSVPCRQAVITLIARNAYTMPSILDRLGDIDDGVRRSVYLQMSSYPVRSLKIQQRITFLEYGFNDRSEAIHKVVHSVLLPNWLKSYDKQYVTFIRALKMDDTYEMVQRSRKVSKQSLFGLFKNETIDELLNQLAISKTGEFAYCIPIEELTTEDIVYWQCVVEHIKRVDENGDDEFDRFHEAICELSVFIEYLTKFIEHSNEIRTADPDSFEADESQYKLLLLIEILMKFDLGDEVGRQNLQAFLTRTLLTQTLNQTVIQRLVQCIEEMIPDLNDRTQYCSELMRQIIEPIAVVDICDVSVTERLATITDERIKDRLNQLKLHIIELQEREIDASDENELDGISDELHEYRQMFANILKANASMHPDQSHTSTASTITAKKLSKDWTIHCLDIFFYTMCSPKTDRMTPNVRELYESFIQRHMRSKCMETRNRALRCGAVCGMLNERLVDDIYNRLYQQILRHNDAIIWESSITGLFELLDRYGLDRFASPDVSINGVIEENNNLVMNLMMVLLHNCNITKIRLAIIIGLCRLVLSDRNQQPDIVVQLLLRFFDQSTEPEISQVLSVFMNTLCQFKRQACLKEALVPTVMFILNEGGSYESPAVIIDFIINTAVQENHRKELHTDIARTFLQTMLANVDDKNVLKLFSDPLPNLGIDSSDLVRNELKELAERLLDEPIHNKLIEVKIKKFIKQLFDSNHNSSQSHHSEQSHLSPPLEQSQFSPPLEQVQHSSPVERSPQPGPSGITAQNQSPRPGPSRRATQRQRDTLFDSSYDKEPSQPLEQEQSPIEPSPQPGPSGIPTQHQRESWDTSFNDSPY